MKKIIFLFLQVVICGSISAQIWSNPITGTNPNLDNPYTTGQTVDPNITVSGIGRGSGISGASANDRYSASGWNTSIPATLDINDYFYFTLTPNAGYQIDFSSFTYTAQRSNSGPQNFSFRSSLDNFATDIGAPTATGTTIVLSATQFQNITAPITFRLYGYGATGGAGTFSVNDFQFVAGVALPVTFGEIQVTQSAERLNIQWSTLTETNNDHFDVEVSQNGKDFTKIATIKSKAVNGNSATPLQYEFTTPVSAMALAAISAFLAILSIGIKNRSSQIAILSITLLITIFFVSCQKGNNVGREAASKIFVRVVQVDIDGTKSYSKIVKAIEE